MAAPSSSRTTERATTPSSPQPPPSVQQRSLESLLARIEDALGGLIQLISGSAPVRSSRAPHTPDPPSPRGVDPGASEDRAGARESGEARAYRWENGRLQPIWHPDAFPLDRLIGVETSIGRMRANVAAFCSDRPHLDMLLYGERGTGKSSAIRGLLDEFGPIGLRIVEVDALGLTDLPQIFSEVRSRTERFILYSDDLSYDRGDPGYRHLKRALDGGLERRPRNVMIAVTSNRRHLLSEKRSDNDEAELDASGELHPGETVEETISLSDRFGLALPFLSFDQDTYLQIVDAHARVLGLADRLSREELHARAIRFALRRGGRSGRAALHACIEIHQELSHTASPESHTQ